mmetsp:Transcript_39198/g.68877  ORF Transcript_39198/g.68877 Transcript_39198/m.68877 type:complete len:415 (-) Transcript_39198:401-1645(-)
MHVHCYFHGHHNDCSHCHYFHSAREIAQRRHRHQQHKYYHHHGFLLHRFPLPRKIHWGRTRSIGTEPVPSFHPEYCQCGHFCSWHDHHALCRHLVCHGWNLHTMNQKAGHYSDDLVHVAEAAGHDSDLVHYRYHFCRYRGLNSEIHRPFGSLETSVHHDSGLFRYHHTSSETHHLSGILDFHCVGHGYCLPGHHDYSDLHIYPHFGILDYFDRNYSSPNHCHLHYSHNLLLHHSVHHILHRHHHIPVHHHRKIDVPTRQAATAPFASYHNLSYSSHSLSHAVVFLRDASVGSWMACGILSRVISSFHWMLDDILPIVLTPVVVVVVCSTRNYYFRWYHCCWSYLSKDLPPESRIFHSPNSPLHTVHPTMLWHPHWLARPNQSPPRSCRGWDTHRTTSRSFQRGRVGRPSMTFSF